MSPVAPAYKTPAAKINDIDLPFRTGLVIAAILVVLCFLSAMTAPQSYDAETMSMLVGP
jgi:hypothetical protein